MSPAIVAYIPVLHEGYKRLFERHAEANELFIFGNDVIGSFEHLVKDIRRLDPQLIQQAITSWNRFERVSILTEQTIRELQEAGRPLIVSDDDLTAALIATHFPNNPVTTDTIFLRWDKKTSIEPVQISPDMTTSEAAVDQELIQIAQQEGAKSPDWWRRIGAIVVKDGAVILRAHNTYVPSDQTAMDEGDPRSNFKSGIHLESSLALHSEAALVAEAAKRGIALEGTSVYCDTFPCPPCAKQLAYAGIKKLYYRIGYAVLDGERILKSQGVEIIFVRPASDSSSADRT